MPFRPLAAPCSWSYLPACKSCKIFQWHWSLRMPRCVHKVHVVWSQSAWFVKQINKTIDLKKCKRSLTFPIPVHEAYIWGDFFRVVANCIPPVKNRIEKMKIKCLLFDGFFMVCFHLYRQKVATRVLWKCGWVCLVKIKFQFFNLKFINFHVKIWNQLCDWTTFITFIIRCICLQW